MKRHIGIIIFVTLFVASVSIIAILIARGYNFTERQIKENGILEVQTILDGVTIFINDKDEGKSSKKIELESGTYNLKLVKEGYITWQKEIEITPGIVNIVEATLFPEKKELEQLTFSDIDKAFFSDDGNIALYTIIKKPNKGIWVTTLEKTIFEISTEKPSKIATLDIIPEDVIQNGNYSFAISPNNQRALLIIDKANVADFYLFDITNTNSKPNYINNEIGFNPSGVEFGSDPNNLIIQDKQTISHFKIDSNRLSLIARVKEELNPKVTSFGRDQYLLLDMDIEKQTPTLFNIGADLRRSPFKINPKVNLKTAKSISGYFENQDFFAISSTDGSYIYNTKDDKTPLKQIAPEQVSFVSWASDGLTLLFSQEGTLKSAIITKLTNNSIKITVNEVIENYDDKSIVAKWTSNAEQLLIHNSESNTLYSIDKDGRNKVILFDKELSAPDSYIMSKSATFLVVLLKDSKNSSNLYTVKLRI